MAVTTEELDLALSSLAEKRQAWARTSVEERCVIEAPFRPFPRNVLHCLFTLLPRPPWFVTNKKADKPGMLLTWFQHSPGWLKIPRIFLNALLG